MFTGVERKVWKPAPHQRKGIKWLTSHPSGALLWKPGLGKTSTTFEAFADLHKRRHAKRLLVIAGLRVCMGVWRQEQAKWANWDHFKIGFAHGPGREEVLLGSEYHIVLLNYDGIAWAAPYLEPGLFDVVCFDELTRMKHTSTRRFKLMKPLLGNFKFRWGLTGSPAPNGLMDLFGQVMTLDGGARLGRYITHYRLQFFHQKPWDQWTWYPNEGAHDEITKRLKNLAFYVEEKVINKMPTLTNVVLKAVMPKEAMAQYKKFERDYIIKLKEDKTLTAATAAVLALKLRQCASGAVYGENREVMHIHDGKLDVLEDLVEELNGDPVLIGVGYLHEVEAIRKRLGTNIPYLGGGVSAKEMDKIITRWNMGWTPVLLAHPTSVAHGLNLQAGGCTVAWYSLTVNAEEHMQFVRRVYRQGQKRNVTVYYIETEGTIDKYLHDMVDSKDRVEFNFLRALKEHFQIK